jgi:hypothetical protein
LASARRNNKFIPQITIQAQNPKDLTTSVTSNPEILNEFTTFYKNILGTSTQCGIKPCLNNLYPQVNVDHLRQLTDPISLQEIKKVVLDLPKDKAIGPDDFSIEFFQQYWSTISGDKHRIITSFYSNELDL